MDWLVSLPGSWGNDGAVGLPVGLLALDDLEDNESNSCGYRLLELGV